VEQLQGMEGFGAMAGMANQGWGERPPLFSGAPGPGGGDDSRFRREQLSVYYKTRICNRWAISNSTRFPVALLSSPVHLASARAWGSTFIRAVLHALLQGFVVPSMSSS
jgi:hypothetical protein